MDFNKITNQELLTRLEKLTQTERKLTHVILCHINEMESRRLYAELGYDSMLAYLIKHLAYSESAAYRRLQAARLLKQIPSVADKIESGALNLSQLTQVQKCLKEESKKTGMTPTKERTEGILDSLENKTSFQTEKVLALKFDRPVQTHEVLKPQKDNSVRVELSFTQEEYEILQQAKNLLSHSCPDGSLKEVIVHLAKKLVRAKIGKDFQPSQPSTLSSTQHNSEAEKTPDASKENFKPEENPRGIHDKVKSQNKPREFISLKTQRILMQKANNCCEYVHPQTGVRCESKYQLQIEHINPIAFGGSNEIENLMILCRTHNLHAAENLGLSRAAHIYAQPSQ